MLIHHTENREIVVSLEDRSAIGRPGIRGSFSLVKRKWKYIYPPHNTNDIVLN